MALEGFSDCGKPNQLLARTNLKLAMGPAVHHYSHFGWKASSVVADVAGKMDI